MEENKQNSSTKKPINTSVMGLVQQNKAVIKFGMLLESKKLTLFTKSVLKTML